MKRGFFIALAAVILAGNLQAQTVKTGVLVVGNGSNALGAGIQAAKSGVKTIILMTEAGFSPALSSKSIVSGIERDFLKAINNGKQVSAQENTNDLIKLFTDTIKNLTIIKSASWTKFKRSGGGWVVDLTNKSSIKAKVLVDADHSGKLKQALEIEVKAPTWQELDYSNTIYKTSIAAGFEAGSTNVNFLSLYQFLIPEQDNYLVLNPEQESFSGGQAAGATAAYAAFFDRKTSDSNLKNIQGELINFRLSVMPFSDVNDLDSNWKAMQFMGLSGILKAELVNGTALFHPEKVVTVAEITQPLKDHFYKAQIWFDDNKGKEMTIGSTIDLVCYTGGKSPATTKAQIMKYWKTKFKFSSEFNEKRVINRREFSMLFYSYNNPFNVIVDKTGRITR
ncbi:MAG: hypothetical protein H7223_13570 [Pedobacter sp.]|nr:hypothetical protein [Pedobacter sp.]